MGRQSLKGDINYMEDQTAAHLLMACIVSAFSILLVVVTCIMKWELWTIPIVVIFIAIMWMTYIGRIGTEDSYVYLCTGIMAVEIYYYGVHTGSFNTMPAVVCALLFILALSNKKGLLYMAGGVYALVLLYHVFFIGDINIHMGRQGIIQIVTGLMATVSSLILSAGMIEKRRAEKKRLFEMAEQMEETMRKNAQFLSNVSHELRTPINMVTGISEIALKKEMPLPLREDMLSIQMAGKRLAGQINNILDYTEILGDSLVVINEKYMISSVINDVVTRAARQNEKQDVELIFDLDTTIPSFLVGDAGKISRVIRLVLENSMKFTEEGGIYIRVGYRQESSGLNLDIDICDTGIGMSPGQVAKVYDDFYQADAGYNRCAGGLGLGLPIVQGLLCAMGGCMHVESTQGEGTKVHISIPQAVADDTPSMALENPKQFCIGCYFKQETYSRQEVRRYYDEMVQHLAKGLGLEAYRIHQFERLEDMINSHKFTHLFIALPEYEEETAYFEELAKSICVVLVAPGGVVLPAQSSLVFLPKPIFALPVVNLLNGVTHGRDLGECLLKDRVFHCRDIRALVVDDEEMNLVVAKGILNNYNIEIDTCPSGAEAVVQCTDTDYDLIFLDHMMPGMDGVETMKQIRLVRDGFYETIPIIALTANAISGAREMFRKEGFTEFVSKPIERSVLERVLRKVLPKDAILYDGDDVRIENGAVPAVRDGQMAERVTQSVEDRQSENGAAPAVGVSQSAESVTLPGEDTAIAAGITDADTDQAAESARASGQEADSPLLKLAAFGIDTKLGLDYCYGALDFYLEMLRMYCSQSIEHRAEVVEMFEKEDWESYVVKVHALKSTSLTIGAKQVSEQAKALEMAGKKQDIAYIKENHALFVQAYDALCKGIEDNVPAESSGES